MTRVALIRQKYNAAGGAERFVSRALTALAARQSIHVTLLARQWENSNAWHTHTVNPFFIGKIWRDVSFSRHVRRLIAKGQFDLVQSHERIVGCQVYRAGDGVHREWLQQRARAQTVFSRLSTVLTPYHHYVCNAERQLFESTTLQAVICISKQVQNNILSHFTIDPAKLHVLYNGVDTTLFHPVLKEKYRQPIRHTLGIPDDAAILLFVGSGFERKGLATLLRAIAHTQQSCYLLVVGYDKHRHRYQELARQLKIAQWVRFLGPQFDVTPYYGAADALTMPPLYEPFGNVFLEAMASGLPILTSDTAGAAELVQEGINGHVCDALDVAGIAEVIRSFQSISYCSQLGIRARETAEQFTLERYVEALEVLYQQWLDI